MRTGFVFGLLCLLILVTHAADPEFPDSVLCSIKATGNITAEFGDEVYVGNGTMKTVNHAAIYEFAAKDVNGTSDPIVFKRLVRPDLTRNGRTYLHYGSDGSSSSRDRDGWVKPSDFKYKADFKPIPDMEYNAFYASVSKIPSMAMLFSKDNKKLIGEWYQLESGSNQKTVTIIYDTVEYFEHNTVDDTFSMAVRNEPMYSTNCTIALSSECKSSGGSTISASMLLVVFVIALLSFTLF